MKTLGNSPPGDNILPFEMGYLPDAYVRKAEVELNETPENRIESVRLLRELAKKDKVTDSLQQELDDEYMMRFLRAKKFNLVRAYSLLKGCANMKRRYPSLLSNISFERLVVTCKKNLLNFLPSRCQDGCAILLIRIDDWDPEELVIEDVKRLVILTILTSLRDPMTQVNGIKVIFDMKSNPIRHLRHCTPSNMYLIYHGTQECAPARYKGVHVINESITCKAAWFIIKHFLSAKLKRRIYFHNHPSNLLNFFPAAILPKEYGGELESFDQTEWLRRTTMPENLNTYAGAPVVCP